MQTSRKPDENDRARGRELARLRKVVGLSQEQLAGRLGISAKQLGKYERGLNRMSAGRYEAALRILRGHAGGSGFAESRRLTAGRIWRGRLCCCRLVSFRPIFIRCTAFIIKWRIA